MILAATGHRPNKLIRYYPKPDLDDFLTDFAVDHLRRLAPAEVISGMALGWDTAVALAAVRLGIPFTAACPFRGQEQLWSGKQQARYRDLLSKAKKVEFVCKHRLDIAFQERNEWMVDRCTDLLSLHDGSQGGTHNCLRYAYGWSVPVIPTWADFMDRISDGNLE